MHRSIKKLFFKAQNKDIQKTLVLIPFFNKGLPDNNYLKETYLLGRLLG